MPTATAVEPPSPRTNCSVLRCVMSVLALGVVAAGAALTISPAELTAADGAYDSPNQATRAHWKYKIEWRDGKKVIHKYPIDTSPGTIYTPGGRPKKKTTWSQWKQGKKKWQPQRSGYPGSTSKPHGNNNSPSPLPYSTRLNPYTRQN